MDESEFADHAREAVEDRERYVCPECGSERFHYYSEGTYSTLVLVCVECGGVGAVPEGKA